MFTALLHQHADRDAPLTHLQRFLLISLTIFGHGFTLALVFFGVHLTLLDILLVRSGQIPKFLGVLTVLGGLGHFIKSVLTFAAPELAAVVAPTLDMLAISKILLALWLIVRGIKNLLPDPCKPHQHTLSIPIYYTSVQKRNPHPS